MSKASLSYKDLSLQTIITNNHRCSEDVRAFSKKNWSKLPLYSSSSKVFKENVGKTYEDAITFWYEENERKKILLIKQLSARSLNTIALLATFRRSK